MTLTNMKRQLRRRDPYAKEVRTEKYRQRVEPSKKKDYIRCKEKRSGNAKDILFLGTCVIENAHLTSTRLGREIEDLGFKSTYARLKKLYKELD